jgi:hypothetical protein
MTPYEKLKSLPLPEQFLKPGITFLQLDALASAMSDNPKNGIRLVRLRRFMRST